MAKKLIKAGHLRRYSIEIEHRVELGQAMDKVTAVAAAPLESRPAINYILGRPSYDKYQLKCQQKKLLRVATVKARINAIHTGADMKKPSQ